MIDRLLAEPYRFRFFQAVRLLRGRQRHGDAAETTSLPVSFRNSISLAFPPSETAEFELHPAAEAVAPGVDVLSKIGSVVMAPAFMGLLGAGGALPAFYTVLMAEQQHRHRDGAARAFIDIFQHRLVELSYLAWRKHSIAIEVETDRRNRYTPLLLALAGVGHPALRDRLRAPEGGVSDDALVYFSGALAQRPRSAATIRQILAAYFAVPVQMQQFAGRWFALSREHQTSLDGRPQGGLGRGAVVGERLWQRDLRARLVFGPMDLDRFRRFLPGGTAALALNEWLTFLGNVALEYEVRLVLRAQDVRSLRLRQSSGARLGWDTFLVTQDADRDRDDAGYDLHAIN